MSDFVPTIHATRAELNTELFWTIHIDPVAREHGMERPTMLAVDWPNDRECHMLKTPDGTLLLVIRTDLEGP